MIYNPKRTCSTCQNCWARTVDVPDFKVGDVPLEFVYESFCNVDKESLGSPYNTRAEFCKDYVERKDIKY